MGKSKLFYSLKNTRNHLMMILIVYSMSGCIESNELSKNNVSCDSEAYKELKEYSLKTSQWGGTPPSKNLNVTFSDVTQSNASVNEASLLSLNAANEYEVVLKDQNGPIRFTNGAIGCYTVPPCLKADGSLKKAGTICADSGSQPADLSIRSIENYNCENLSLTSTYADFKNLSSPNCEDKVKSQSGIYRFRVKSGSNQTIQGNPNLWFTDDNGSGYQATIGVSP